MQPPQVGGSIEFGPLEKIATNKYFIGVVMILMNIGARFMIEELTPEQKKYIVDNCIFENIKFKNITRFLKSFFQNKWPISKTKIFPSPICPVAAACWSTSRAFSSISSGTATSIRVFGTKVISYSAPLYISIFLFVQVACQNHVLHLLLAFGYQFGSKHYVLRLT